MTKLYCFGLQHFQAVLFYFKLYFVNIIIHRDPKWQVYVIVVLAGLLVFALIRGCNHSKNHAALTVNYKVRISDLEKDSIDRIRQLHAYRDTLEFINGQLSLTDNKLLSLDEDLRGANDRITTLLKKHVPMLPSLDTNVTTVPNVFIDECADCFKELASGQKLVAMYKAEREGQETAHKNLLRVKDNRISSLEKSNASILKSYTTLLDSSERFQNKHIPRGRLYLSWGVILGSREKMVGAGLLYQTRNNMLYGSKWYYGANGTMVQASINFPLSLRK